MSLRSVLSLLLLFTFDVSAAAVPASSWATLAQSPPYHNLQLDERSPNYNHRPDFILRGKNARERMVALCEAGFIPACRASVAGAESIAKLDGELRTVHRVPPGILSANARDDYDDDDVDSISSILLRLFGFFVVSLAVIGVITVIRKL
ncbi:uncharacterized protein PFLUO_LOCUS8122 [Penicillium psychrofluorescens]|uniref:uncharacterized protein n=1 Tax=Penicillium psychrofluorescens TaxID=3158075 RepID=UPI003CCCA8A1